MIENMNDKGLRKALHEPEQFRLPSNFNFRIMQKIEENIRIRERRIERRTFYATIIAALLLLGSCITGLTIYFGDSIRKAFTLTINFEKPQIPSFYLLIIIAIPIFFLFDHWMRKQYFKNHS